MNISLSIIITIVTGKLCDSFENLQNSLEYIMETSILTQQIPIAMKFAKNYILDLYPELKNINGNLITVDNIDNKLIEFQNQYGESLFINPATLEIREQLEKKLMDDFYDFISR